MHNTQKRKKNEKKKKKRKRKESRISCVKKIKHRTKHFFIVGLTMMWGGDEKSC